LQDVRIAFGGPELIDGVTLQIERRERVCLVGRNGAGKSTLMKSSSLTAVMSSGNRACG
jgi:ATP-binding cassette subfamily F protein uup